MKKSELEGMIREMVREAVATEMSNAFRYIMKEQFLNYSNKGGMLKEVSGNKEDYAPYPEIRNTTPTAGPELNRAEFANHYKQMMDGEMGTSVGHVAPVSVLPTTNPDGRPINLNAANKDVISAITKDYRSFMKTFSK